MSMKRQLKKKQPAQDEVDGLVIAQADDDRAWGRTVRVKRLPSAALSIPGELAARAAFLARLHREARVENWLERVIRERVEMEEVAYRETRREMASR